MAKWNAKDLRSCFSSLFVFIGIVSFSCSSSQTSLNNQREPFYSPARLIKFEEIYVGDRVYFTVQVDWTGDLKTDVLYCYNIIEHNEEGLAVTDQLPSRIQYYKWFPTTYLKDGQSMIKDRVRLAFIEFDKDLDGEIDSVWYAPKSNSLPSHILIDP